MFECGNEVIAAADLLTVDLLNDVAGLQSRAGGGPGGIDVSDRRAADAVALAEVNTEPGGVLVFRL